MRSLVAAAVLACCLPLLAESEPVAVSATQAPAEPSAAQSASPTPTTPLPSAIPLPAVTPTPRLSTSRLIQGAIAPVGAPEPTVPAAIVTLAPVKSAAPVTPSPILPSAPVPAPADDEKILIQLEQDWCRAIVSHDAAFLERVEADEYVYTDPTGKTSTKRDNVQAARAGTPHVGSFKVHGIQAHVYGNTAVLTGQTTLGTADPGDDLAGEYRWTDVFVRRAGEWQVVASQAGILSPAD